MAAKETGKERALRIPLDYYKKPDALQKCKRWLAGIALALAALWIGATLWAHDEQPYAPGPVAAVHAAWDGQCMACHQDLSPRQNFMRHVSGAAHQDNLLCATCHAAPVHHGIAKAERTPECAECHREHQGRKVLLTRNEDRECTGCHRDVASSRDDAKASSERRIPIFNSITDFATDHPPFQSIKDPRKLKFNHQLHLTRGLVSDEKIKPWTFSKMEGLEERKRYMTLLVQADEGAAVQLTCAACHQADASDVASWREHPASRPAGAYMQPIRFENHCQACHPLTILGPDDKEIAVPHRLQPDEVRNFVWGAMAKSENQKREIEVHQPTRNLPTASEVRRQIQEKTTEGLKFLEKEKVEETTKFLRSKTNCRKCHEYVRPGDVDSPIVPTEIPTVWYKSARFDHTAHRALECLSCHRATAVTDSLGTVSLPGRDECLKCHGPARGSGNSLSGGARGDCVECHRYHHGDIQLHGIGAPARDPLLKFATPAQFLSGARSP